MLNWNSYFVFSAWSCTRLLWQSGSRTQAYLQVYQNTVSCSSTHCRVCHYYTCKSCLCNVQKCWFFILIISGDRFLFWKKNQWAPNIFSNTGHMLVIKHICSPWWREVHWNLWTFQRIQHQKQNPWQHKDTDSSQTFIQTLARLIQILTNSPLPPLYWRLLSCGFFSHSLWYVWLCLFPLHTSGLPWKAFDLCWDRRASWKLEKDFIRCYFTVI